MTSDEFGTGSRTVEAVASARDVVAETLESLGLASLTADAVLVASELVTNAVLHGEGLVDVRVDPLDAGVRISVEDRARTPPVVALANPDAMTGRGLLLVSSLAIRWGADLTDSGKVVWAELVPGRVPPDLTEEELLALWDGEGWASAGESELRHHVVLGEVPTDLLLAAKTHVDNLVREFTLTASGAATGTTGPVPPHLASLIETVVTGFADARRAIKRQAVDAARRGDERVRLELSLPAEAADAGEAYLEALDEADAYSRAARLLTLETPPQHRVFRQWYVGELVRQLRAAAAGEAPPRSETFEQRLLREIDTVSEAQRVSARGARLSEVAAALSGASTPEDVAAAVLEHGVAALDASAGGLLFATASGGIEVPGTLGYDETVVARLRASHWTPSCRPPSRCGPARRCGWNHARSVTPASRSWWGWSTTPSRCAPCPCWSPGAASARCDSASRRPACSTSRSAGSSPPSPRRPHRRSSGRSCTRSAST